MLIDLIFVLFMLMAILKGLRNGLIIAVFSLVGWIVGVYAAVHFSDVAAGWLSGYVSPRWLSLVSFLAVLLVVMLLVRIGATMIGKVVEITMLGWANRIGGIIFYVLLYAFLLSVVISFAEKVHLVGAETLSSSKVYPWIKPLARFTQLSLFH